MVHVSILWNIYATGYRKQRLAGFTMHAIALSRDRRQSPN